MTFKSVTLLDPLVYKYSLLKNATYYSGKFIINKKSYPTILTNESVESFGKTLLLKQQQPPQPPQQNQKLKLQQQQQNNNNNQLK